MIFILYNIYLNLSGERTWRVLQSWTWEYFAVEIVFGIRSRADSAFFQLIFILLRTLICNHFEFEGSTSFKSNGHDQGWGKFFTGCFWRKEILPRKSRDRRNPIQVFFYFKYHMNDGISQRNQFKQFINQCCCSVQVELPNEWFWGDLEWRFHFVNLYKLFFNYIILII